LYSAGVVAVTGISAENDGHLIATGVGERQGVAVKRHQQTGGVRTPGIGTTIRSQRRILDVIEDIAEQEIAPAAENVEPAAEANEFDINESPASRSM
jgi:hypothetical protein